MQLVVAAQVMKNNYARACLSVKKWKEKDFNPVLYSSFQARIWGSNAASGALHGGSSKYQHRIPCQDQQVGLWYFHNSCGSHKRHSASWKLALH